MNKNIYLLSVLLVLSIISGVLLSKASLVGRTGINLFYKEYKFLKLWWQGSLVVLAAFLLVVGIHGLFEKTLSRKNAGRVHMMSIVIALTGLYFTYQDFRHTLSHRLLGERFHLGGYLFWVGWIIIALYFLLVIRYKKERTEIYSHLN